jgi:hypothetical protein
LKKKSENIALYSHLQQEPLVQEFTVGVVGVDDGAGVVGIEGAKVGLLL